MDTTLPAEAPRPVVNITGLHGLLITPSMRATIMAKLDKVCVLDDSLTAISLTVYTREHEPRWAVVIRAQASQGITYYVSGKGGDFYVATTRAAEAFRRKMRKTKTRRTSSRRHKKCVAYA